MQGEIDGVAVGIELAAKATSATEQLASLSLHRGLLGDETLFVAERGVLGEYRESEGVQSVVGEVDDDDLWSGDESVEASSLHRFFPVGGFGLGA